jgi:hypothetical protein
MVACDQITDQDDPRQIREWQEHLRSKGVWVSEPEPMFLLPGSSLYQQAFGAVLDNYAGERAHDVYTSTFADKGYSDIQEQRPAPIEDPENAHLGHR